MSLKLSLFPLEAAKTYTAIQRQKLCLYIILPLLKDFINIT